MVLGLILASGDMAPVALAVEQEPLLSTWNDGASRKAIVDYVKKVTDRATQSFIPPEDRIAVFDNDGTLWTEKPLYGQLLFAFDRVKKLAPKHPDWKVKQPFAAVLSGDRQRLAKMSEAETLQLVAATHSGMTEKDFEQEVSDWVRTAKLKTYSPMVALLGYLRENGFKTFIVTGGGSEFVRGFSVRAYGIPPEQVVGTNAVMKFQIRSGKPDLIRQAKIDPPITDKAGKPVGIQRQIGKVPVIAVGNSDGDLQMLQYTEASSHPTLKILVHHDDGKRESAYDQGAERILKEARSHGWVIVSMIKDFKTIFGAPENQLGGHAGE